MLELFRNAETDADLARAFAFASPRLRGQVKNEAGFVWVLRNPRYAPLIGFNEVEIGMLEQLGRAARQDVRVWSNGLWTPFLFALLRPKDGRWLLSGISRGDVFE